MVLQIYKFKILIVISVTKVSLFRILENFPNCVVDEEEHLKSQCKFRLNHWLLSLKVLGRKWLENQTLENLLLLQKSYLEALFGNEEYVVKNMAFM